MNDELKNVVYKAQAAQAEVDEILATQEVAPAGNADVWRDGLEKAAEVLDMNTFDYMNNTMSEWITQFSEGVVGSTEDLLVMIEEEYLPRFEAAVWQQAAILNAQGVKVTNVGLE